MPSPCADFFAGSRHVASTNLVPSARTTFRPTVEMLTRSYKAPTVKQHLAAIRMLFDWLIVGQVVGQNPAAAVRGPKHIVNKGKTPVLDGDEARRLLESIDTRPCGRISPASTRMQN